MAAPCDMRRGDVESLRDYDGALHGMVGVARHWRMGHHAGMMWRAADMRWLAGGMMRLHGVLG